VDDDRRFTNNPFARAVVRPDDEKATSPILYVLVGILSLVLAAVFVAALVLPPMFMHTLIIRGIRSGRPAMLALGLLLAAIYLFVLWAVGKRLMGRQQPPPPEQ
jgi:hypothetical protein